MPVWHSRSQSGGLLLTKTSSTASARAVAAALQIKSPREAFSEAETIKAGREDSQPAAEHELPVPLMDTASQERLMVCSAAIICWLKSDHDLARHILQQRLWLTNTS